MHDPLGYISRPLAVHHEQPGSFVRYFVLKFKLKVYNWVNSHGIACRAQCRTTLVRKTRLSF